MYTKALHAEFVTAVVESEFGLVAALCKEFQKTVKLMLTKIEGMVLSGPDSRKISSQNGFVRTGQQEHNSQLFALVVQFKEAVEKFPAQVMKTSREQQLASGGILSSSSGGNSRSAVGTGGVADASTAHQSIRGNSEFGEEVAGGASIQAELEIAAALAVSEINALAQKEFMEPIVALLGGTYFCICRQLCKSGLIKPTHVFRVYQIGITQYS